MTTEHDARRITSAQNGRKWGGLSREAACQAYKDGYLYGRTNDRRKICCYIAKHGYYMTAGGDVPGEKEAFNKWVENEVLAVIRKWYRETR